MLQHLNWLEQISEVVLREVNVSLEDYIDTITTPGVPLDFVALLFLCRIYYIHIAVFTARGVWSTSRQTKKNDCLFGVVFNGNFKFTETIKAGCGEEYRQWLEDRAKKGKMPSHAKPCMPGQIKMEGSLCSLSDALGIVNNNVLCKHKPSIPDKDTVLEIKKEFGIPDFQALIKPKSEICETVPKTETTPEKTTPKEDFYAKISCSPKNEDSAEKSDTSEEDVQVLRCDIMLPYSDTEIENLWQNVTSTVNQAQAAVGGVVPDKMVEQQEENEEIVLDDLLLTCPMCLHTETTQKACIQHIDTWHPEYRYPCRFCDKDFNCFHTWYRHKQSHWEHKHICGDCGSSFLYWSELERHTAVHKDVLPFYCTKCDKRFAQKKSLKRHEVLHIGTTYKCDQCDKVCDSPDCLYSHKRGAHGKGYTSKCGKYNYQWPTGQSRHAAVCDECKDITAKELSRKCKNLDSTAPKMEKKIKTESSEAQETVADLKSKVQCKIENILHLKQDIGTE